MAGLAANISSLLGGPDVSALIARIPQDPFVPSGGVPTTPAFLDDGACLCALQQLPHAKGQNSLAWQCIGNQTQDVYSIMSGKWFNSQNGGAAIDLAINDNSNPPDTSQQLVWDYQSESLVPLQKESNLSPNDAACTGNNRTSFSTTFYRASEHALKGQLDPYALPCLRPGAVPVLLQDAKSWQSHGCSEGFLCANNTANTLPQFCTPIEACEASRLFGSTCEYEGQNIPMGQFEPVLCRQGYYCPKNATAPIRCPAGHYCQPGAGTPTPCAIGSSCPEGSSYQLVVIPLIVLIFVDVVLLLGLLLLKIREKKVARGLTTKQTLKRSATLRTTTYNVLPGETESDIYAADVYAGPSPGQDEFFPFTADVEALQDPPTIGITRAETALTLERNAFVASLRKATDSGHCGLSFGYSHLKFQPKGVSRPIIDDVTGEIERGSLVAVMGGSGAGKSTFVNVLMGKASHTGGVVTINNVPGKAKKYRKLIGFVPQDDVVLPELTVFENIVHSARIRMPRTWTSHEIEAHADAVIDCLELSHVRDSRVGSVGKPILSGGQRKRVSIGMELAAAPMAIFLDEPTSGLDATSASSIMRTLKAIARLGITVIVVIHQPRLEIFEMLDSLILLGNGRMIYQGPEAQVKPFFECLGFRFPEHSNTADIVTDIITGNGRKYKGAGDVSKESLIENWASFNRKETLSEKESSLSDNLTADGLERISKNRGATFMQQFWLCLRRAMLQQYRTKTALGAECSLAFLAGFLLGLAQNGKKGVMFAGLYKEPYAMLSTAIDFTSIPQMTLVVAIGIGLTGAAPGVRIFSEEILLQSREAEAGHSRLAYFLAKAASALPRMVLSNLHFTTLLFVLAVPVMPWSIGFVANLLYLYCIYGLSSCVSMVFRREDAPLFATMIALIVAILSGVTPSLAKVNMWHLGWLWRASPGVWFAEVYFGQGISPFGYLYQLDIAVAAFGLHLDRLWCNLAVLAGIGTLYRILAFVGLVTGKRLRT